jgi:hypothetical protein
MITITPRAESRGDNGSRWLLSRQARTVVSLALPTQSYSMSAVLRSANGVLRSHPPCPGEGAWVRGCVGAAVALHLPDEATTAPLIDEPLPWESPRPPCSPRTLPGPNYRLSHTCTPAGLVVVVAVSEQSSAASRGPRSILADVTCPCANLEAASWLETMARDESAAQMTSTRRVQRWAASRPAAIRYSLAPCGRQSTASWSSTAECHG